MSADTVIHNLVVRVFFAFTLAATVFVLLVGTSFYFGWFSTQTILMVTATVFLVGITIGTDRAEKVLDWFKLFFWMGSGES